jgi:hypothetical protein
MAADVRNSCDARVLCYIPPHDAETLRQLLARVLAEVGERLSPELLNAFAEVLQ